MAVRKKQDDSNLKILRELVTNGGNRQCFDCGQKGPTYANITIGSFVCTRCSGVLRGLTPPHRVKSISMATFTPEEIEFLKSHGNDDCAKTWLGLWDPKRTVHQDQRELMIDKYERKRYYLEPASPLKSLTNAATSKLSSSSSLSSSSVSSLSAASNNISNSNNNINMTNGYTYLNDNNNINNNNNNINNNINNNHNKISNFNSSNLINNGHHHQNSNGILAPPSPKHHNVSTTSSSSLSSSTGGVQQNGFNGTTVYHRPHSNSYYQQQQQQQQQQQLKQNGYSNGLKSNKLGSSLITNGFTPDSDFVADFSSAQIFNATNGNDSSTNRIKSQHNDNSENNNNGINNNNGMNNVFGSSTVGVNENFADFEHAPIYNAVGMPTTMNSNNNFALNSSSTSATTLKSNTTGNSAPSADRYAALKDLDEQLRETKTLSGPPISSVFASTDNLNNSSTINNANPFKTVQSMSGNPFQTNGNLSYNVNGTNGSLFDTSSSQQFQVQQQQSNGFAANTNFGIFNNNYNNNINNNIGNGFNGYNNLNSNGIQQQQQQSIIGGSYATMKNPFVTTSSNNPFL